MAKLLLVDPSPQAVGLRAALTDAKFDVEIAPSGSFALTALEWNRPQAVVSQEALGDMQGDELCAIIRSDPTTRDIPFVLVAALSDGVARDAATAGVDLLLAGDFAPATLVNRISRCVGTAAPLPDDRPPLVPERTFQGSLSVIELTEVIQAIGRSGKTGRLRVTVERGEGVVIFESGRIVHAGHAGEDGEAAVAALIGGAEAGGSFVFTPLAHREAPEHPRTIDATVERLLLTVAAGIDEQRAALAGVAADAPHPAEKG